MITIRDWFKRFHNRPLKIAATFLLATWFVFAYRSFVSISEKQISAVTQTAGLLSMTIPYKDRELTESLLDTLVSQGGAKSAALCKGTQQVIGDNQDLFGCEMEKSLLENVLDRKVPGSGDLVVRAKFDLLAVWSSILRVLGFGLVLVMIGFYFIQVAQSRIEKDILGPLLNKLLSDEQLEIRELNELRDSVRRAKELEAQKAVTLAVQENNEEVAHDIRSPVTSISELLNRVDLQDTELKGALTKAISRAHSVANYLLTGKKEETGSAIEYAYDFALIVNDIAIEKKPLFVGGEIDVIAPKTLYAVSALASGSLARILSNIIDNAILACDSRRNVKIFLTRQETSISITVSDTGRGIPGEIVDKLGQKGVTSRDKSQPAGTGRGVYSAMKTLNNVGGNIYFESSPGVGTTVLLNIPVKKVEPVGVVDLILIDNEEMMRMTWELLAKRQGQKCRTFSSVEEFLAVVDSVPKHTPIFLDSDLGSGKRGQDCAPLLRELGFQRLILATAYSRLVGTTIPFIDCVVGKEFCGGKTLPARTSRSAEIQSSVPDFGQGLTHEEKT